MPRAKTSAMRGAQKNATGPRRKRRPQLANRRLGQKRGAKKKAAQQTASRVLKEKAKPQAKAEIRFFLVRR
jgi:hypothetical protein